MVVISGNDPLSSAYETGTHPSTSYHRMVRVDGNAPRGNFPSKQSQRIYSPLKGATPINIGSPAWDRTTDQQINSLLLYR